MEKRGDDGKEKWKGSRYFTISIISNESLFVSCTSVGSRALYKTVSIEFCLCGWRSRAQRKLGELHKFMRIVKEILFWWLCGACDARAFAVFPSSTSSQ